MGTMTGIDMKISMLMQKLLLFLPFISEVLSAPILGSSRVLGLKNNIIRDPAAICHASEQLGQLNELYVDLELFIGCQLYQNLHSLHLLYLGTDLSWEQVAASYTGSFNWTLALEHMPQLNEFTAYSTASDLDLLSYALANGQSDLAAMVASKQASHFLLSEQGNRLFILAALHNNLNVLKILNNKIHDRMPLDKVKYGCLSVLFAAAQGGDEEMLEYLKQQNVNFNYRNKYDYDALFYATLMDRPDMIDLLVRHGLDPRKNGGSALLYAAHENLVPIAAKLLHYGVQVDVFDQYGNTPLMFAAGLPDPQMASLLLSYGANMDFKNDNNETPYTIAAGNPFNRDTYRQMSDMGAQETFQSDLALAKVLGRYKQIFSH